MRPSRRQGEVAPAQRHQFAGPHALRHDQADRQLKVGAVDGGQRRRDDLHAGDVNGLQELPHVVAIVLVRARGVLQADFSYTTPRDHAFTVTDGVVRGVRRLEPPGNVRWEREVRPDASGYVRLVLPVTTDCAADGAICTGDGRALSNRPE